MLPLCGRTRRRASTPRASRSTSRSSTSALAFLGRTLRRASLRRHRGPPRSNSQSECRQKEEGRDPASRSRPPAQVRRWRRCAFASRRPRCCGCNVYVHDARAQRPSPRMAMRPSRRRPPTRSPTVSDSKSATSPERRREPVDVGVAGERPAARRRPCDRERVGGDGVAGGAESGVKLMSESLRDPMRRGVRM